MSDEMPEDTSAPEPREDQDPTDAAPAPDVDADAVAVDTAAAPGADAAEALTDAAAAGAGGDTSPAATGGEASEASSADAPAGDDEAAARPRLELAQLEAIVEALVYASPEPLTPKMLMKLLSDEPKEDVQAAIDALVARYDQPGGLHLAQVAGGYQITTRPELHDWVRRLFHERNTQKLSVAALETLSVIAYRQPVTAAEVNEIRAVNASGVLSTLLERHLIKIVGRKNVVGRPFLYGTTKEFLIRFGLKDLADLPNMQDMVQALGFDPPALLMETPVTDEMLPLEEGDDPTGALGADTD